MLQAPQDLAIRQDGIVTMRRIVYGFFAFSALTALSISFVDRPLALFVHAQLQGEPGIVQLALRTMTGIPEFLGAMSIFLIVALSLMRLARGSLPEAETIAFLASLSIIVAETLKTALKMAFGRTWPETWIYNNVSLIRDGIYGFTPFNAGPGGSAFPSGHTTGVCAVMSVLWILLPRWRPLYVLTVAATAVGLVGLNSHFLGDVIAGGYLGTAVGVVTVRIALPRR
jgi:membrane-associated phospholipid phosphatase